MYELCHHPAVTFLSLKVPWAGCRGVKTKCSPGPTGFLFLKRTYVPLWDTMTWSGLSASDYYIMCDLRSSLTEKNRDRAIPSRTSHTRDNYSSHYYPHQKFVFVRGGNCPGRIVEEESCPVTKKSSASL